MKGLIFLALRLINVSLAFDVFILIRSKFAFLPLPAIIHQTLVSPLNSWRVKSGRPDLVCSVVVYKQLIMWSHTLRFCFLETWAGSWNNLGKWKHPHSFSCYTSQTLVTERIPELLLVSLTIVLSIHMRLADSIHDTGVAWKQRVFKGLFWGLLQLQRLQGKRRFLQRRRSFQVTTALKANHRSVFPLGQVFAN